MKRTISRSWHRRQMRVLEKQIEALNADVDEARRERDLARGQRDMPLMGDFGAAFCRIFDEHAIPKDDRVFYLQPAACRAVVKAGSRALTVALDNSFYGVRDPIDEWSDLQLYGMSFRPLPGCSP